MAYEQRPNTGALFKNDKKTEDKHPDYKGSALIDGVEMWLSAWIKDGKSGKFMSLSFKPKDGDAKEPPSKERKPELDDSIPF